MSTEVLRNLSSWSNEELHKMLEELVQDATNQIRRYDHWRFQCLDTLIGEQ